MGSGPGSGSRRRQGGGLVFAATGTESLPAKDVRTVVGNPESFQEAVQLAAEFGLKVKFVSTVEEAVQAAGSDKWYGAWKTGSDHILINLPRLPSAQAAARIAQESAKRGWTASSHPLQTFHHEIGHSLHYRNLARRQQVRPGSRTWSQIKKKSVSKRLAKRIAREVSQYAASSRTEIVAEMYAGLKGGKTYGSRLMKYYRALGGVVPKS